MSYTTRCPACGTTFRVVPDQLKISDGWVRCGHCADVFDATLYLQEWTPPPAPLSLAPVPPSQPTPPMPKVLPEQAPESAPVAEPPPVSGPDAAPETALLGVVGAGAEPSPVPAPEPAPVVAASGAAALADGDVSSAAVPAVQQPAEPDTVLDAAVAEPPAPSVVASAPVESRPAVAEHNADAAWPDEPDAMAESASEREAVSLQIGTTGEAPDKPSDETLHESLSPVHSPAPSAVTAAEDGASDFHAELARFAEAAGRTPPAPAAALASEQATMAPDLAAPDEAAPANEESEPGFVRQARRQAFWRSPAVRAVLGVFVLLLGGLQVIQWALHERAPLAATHPELVPLLTQLCAPLGCEIGPVRRIEAVVIDSSTLVRRLGNFYAFDVVIKNTANIPVAVPALELSLTDTRDSVIARRVFLPSELPGAPSLLPAQGSLPLSLRLSITDVGAVPMAGYRALVFYP